MDNNPRMDTQIDVEAVRARFKAVPYVEAMRLATDAGIAPSTAQKFRMGHIVEPGAFKLARLANALAARASGADHRKAA
jgi:hypothetical protein